jgi:phosphate transport system substrate-binding protein
MAFRFVLLLCAALCCIPTAAQPLRGSGSTFAADLYAAWSHGIKGTSAQVDYDAIGSSGGLKQVTAREVDFGASDRPLGRQELDGESLAQFPTAVGAVVVVANVPGVGSDQLKLDGRALADLYLGKIRTWNDPQIAALNPGVRLPAAPVVIVVRGAGSGTSFAFTAYLNKVSGDFAARMKPTSDFNVPDARVARTNRDVAQAVATNQGAVGYLDFSYAAAHRIPTVSLRNRWGSFVQPSEQSVQDAVRLADWEKAMIDQSPTFAMDLTDAPCPTCWPISTLTYVLVPLNPAAGSSANVLSFFEKALDDGDSLAKEAGYVPLPSVAKWRVKLQMRKWLERAPHDRTKRSQGVVASSAA